MVPGRDAEVLGDLPQEVVNTITSAGAPSTRHAYTLKWNLFVEWCSSHREDPRKCPIRVVLSFLLQGWMETAFAPTLAARRTARLWLGTFYRLPIHGLRLLPITTPVDRKSVGKHDWVVRFLRGARRLNPPYPPSIPSWVLSLVLRALQQGPFEPLQTVEPKFLSMKLYSCFHWPPSRGLGTYMQFRLTDSCLEFGPADSQIILRPQPGYVPNVLTIPFRDQVVSSLYKKCGILLGTGSWCFADRYL